MKTIYMIASYGDFSKLPLGGGQTAARRLLATLNNMGYKVTALHRHPPMAKKRFIRGMQFVFWLFLDPILVFNRLVLKPRKDSMTLYMGYMGSILVPLEWIMSLLTRLLGYTNVMYLAGGGTEKVYNGSNHVLKFFERRILNNYKLVLTEGFENIVFVKRISKTRVGYLPNFTEDGFAPTVYPSKPIDKWNFFYFGRVCEEKNVLLSIDIFNNVSRELNDTSLTVVGGGPDYYDAKVENKILQSPYRDRIKRIGRSSHEDLKRMMLDQHFYLFPSNEPREGHSNALNEAMSFGLVPIVSDNNFLPSIVGDDRLVVHELKAESYSGVIVSIIESGEYNDLSQNMYNRVKQHFTQRVVENELKEIIENV